MIFSQLLKSERKLLIVSLPENTFEFARAALENGADAVKLHVNVKHRVTGKIHATWDGIRETVGRIKSEFDPCMGIVPGAENMSGAGEIEEMEKSGISFFDVYVDYAPLYLLRNGMSKMLALNYTYDPSMAGNLKSLGADCVEVSTVNPEKYGSPLTLMDLLRYREVIERAGLPCFLPTQKKVMPEEVKELFEIGFRGLIIGPIVTGTDIKSFSSVVKSFSEAIRY
ncbi:MAG: hypothetical protein AB2L23_06080 [Mesotoga sp.]